MIDRDAILASRWLRPFAHLFGHPTLWHMNRRSFPRGLAIGLFVAFILPVGQFALAALLAVPARANVPVAAAATLVTNPLTMPPIYLAAYKLGEFLLHHAGAAATGKIADNFGGRLLEISGPTAVGLLVFACLGAASGMIFGSIGWRLRQLRRRRAGRSRPSRAD